MDDPVTPPRLALDHYAVSVADIEASVSWYGDLLGFEVERRFSLPGGIGGGVMLSNGITRVELFGLPGAAPLPQGRADPHSDLAVRGNKHPAFVVDDLASWLRWA